MVACRLHVLKITSQNMKYNFTFCFLYHTFLALVKLDCVLCACKLSYDLSDSSIKYGIFKQIYQKKVLYVSEAYDVSINNVNRNCVRNVLMHVR